MSLCSLDDINVHLPADKISVLDADDDALQLDAERIVKGELSGTFTAATLAAWSTPATTPEIIRAVAGRFIAALVYSRAFSAEVDGIPEYAQSLYDQAMLTLTRVISGDIVLLDNVSEATTVGDRLSLDNFSPNGDTPGPFFTMTKAF